MLRLQEITFIIRLIWLAINGPNLKKLAPKKSNWRKWWRKKKKSWHEPWQCRPWSDCSKQCRPRSDCSSIRVYTVCHSVCIVWTHYSMVEPHSSNFRVITTNFLGVRIFRKFTVVKMVHYILTRVTSEHLKRFQPWRLSLHQRNVIRIRIVYWQGEHFSKNIFLGYSENRSWSFMLGIIKLIFWRKVHIFYALLVEISKKIPIKMRKFDLSLKISGLWKIIVGYT